MRNLIKPTLNFKQLLTKTKYGLYIHEYQAYDLLKRYQLPLVPVTHPLSRVLEPAHPMMLMQLLKELCLMSQRANHLLMLLLRLKFMLVEEAKVPSKKAHSKEEFKWQLEPQKSWSMPKK